MDEVSSGAKSDPKRECLLVAVNDVAQILLSSDAESFENKIWRALDFLGTTLDLDRMYVWKSEPDGSGRLRGARAHEWIPGSKPRWGHALSPEFFFEEAVSSWDASLKAGKSVGGLTRNMSEEALNTLSSRSILSLLMTPILIEGQFWGLIVLHDCRTERLFSEAEQDALQLCGRMIAFAMIQNETKASLVVARDEAIASTKAKSSFLANMSHEIRTPMNAILGMAELILREDTTRAVFDQATTIKGACENLLAIINDILDISKVESGKLEIEPVRYQLISLLNDVIGIIKVRTNNKRLFFAVNIDSELPCELLGDEVRIRQILINILGNAVKFTEKGHILFSVGGSVEGDSLKLEFTVADTGMGIHPGRIKNLFSAFRQMDTRKNREIEGSGLGLAISKELCELMNGSIKVESDYGVGSTFKIVLSQKIADKHPIVSVESPGKKNILVYETRGVYAESICSALKSLRYRHQLCQNLSELHEFLNESHFDYLFMASLHYESARSLIRKKQLDMPIVLMLDDDEHFFEKGAVTVSMPLHCVQIARILCDEAAGHDSGVEAAPDLSPIVAPEARVLVVDDNLVNLKVVAGLLKPYEMRVETAISGYVAIEMLKETDYDLIFMDHMMPGMDGIEATIAIRGIGREACSKVPIIALTANAVSGVREMFKAEGLDDYLAKPIEISKLDAILKTWIPEEKQQKGGAGSKKMDTIKTEPRDDKTHDGDIPGVDMQVGLKHVSGSEEVYREILSIFVIDGEQKIGTIRECFETGDIKLLTTHIHAMKSGAANIGAMELSRAAAELEAAGNRGDVEFINQNMDAFIRLLSGAIAGIKSWLGGGSVVEEAPKQATTSLLAEKMAEIEAHIENVEIGQIETTVDQLLSCDWDHDVLQSLRKIKDGISLFDYDALENGVKELRKKIP